MKNTSVLMLSIKLLFRYIGYHIMALLAALGLMAVIPGVIGLCVAQFFCLGIVFVMPYLYVYKLGHEDYNRIKYKHIDCDVFKGLKAGLIGYSPFILASAIIVIAKLFGGLEGYLPFYRLINSPFLPLIQSLLSTALTFNELPLINVIACAATSLLVPLSPTIAYYFGIKRISFVEEFKLVSKDNS